MEGGERGRRRRWEEGRSKKRDVEMGGRRGNEKVREDEGR